MNLMSLAIEDGIIPMYLFLLFKDLYLSIKFFLDPRYYFEDHIGVWGEFYLQMLGAWILQYLLFFQFVDVIFKKPVYRNLNGLYI